MKSKISDNIVAVGGNRGAAIFLSKGKEPVLINPKLKKDSSDSGEWCNWGDDNLFPQRLVKKVKDSGTAGGGLEVLTTAHFGMGIEIYEEIETEKGTELKKRALSKLPEIYAFFKRCQFNTELSDLIDDYEYFRFISKYIEINCL
jgi:hypothetical protein